MTPGEDLARTLERMDGRSYRAYKGLRGGYAFDKLVLFIDHVQGIGEWRMLKFAVHGPIINVQYELDVAGNETLMFRFSTRHGDLARRAGWLRQRGLELKAERWKGRGPWAPAIWEEDDGNTFVIMTLDHPNEAVPPERCRSGDPDRAAAEQPL